jgi:hypothetical protein
LTTLIFLPKKIQHKGLDSKTMNCSYVSKDYRPAQLILR